MYQKLFLLYSSDVHGTSLRTMYHNCNEFSEQSGILLIKENTGNVLLFKIILFYIQIFGAIISELPKVCQHFFGQGNCCVFKYDPKCQFIQVFISFLFHSSRILNGLKETDILSKVILIV